jgi:hypothetical protein
MLQKYNFWWISKTTRILSSGLKLDVQVARKIVSACIKSAMEKAWMPICTCLAMAIHP